MTDSTTFSTRSNAKRAAEKAIDDGSAPSIDYGINSRADFRFEIVWHLKGDGSCTSAGETGIATATAEADTDSPSASELRADELIRVISVVGWFDDARVRAGNVFSLRSRKV